MFKLIVGLLTLASVAQVNAGLLRFPCESLGVGAPDTPLLDPRNGLPSDEYTRYVEAQEQLWVCLPEVLNSYSKGENPNSVAVENLAKFGVNYSVKAGTGYQWYHPTYVWDIFRDLARPVDFGAAYVQPTGTPFSNVSSVGSLREAAGKPLTSSQCAALQAFDDAHDAQAGATIGCASAGSLDCPAARSLSPSVLSSLAAFVETAKNEGQRQLFDLVFTGAIHPDLPPSEVLHQTQGILLDHMDWSAGFNCGTGKAPNIAAIQLAGFSHNQRHMCRATKPLPKVYTRHYVTTYTFHRVTCRDLAFE